jgi:hypothetical protein
MIIRPARIADIPQMARVLVQCWQGGGGGGGGGCASAAPSVAGHPAARHPDFIVCGG